MAASGGQDRDGSVRGTTGYRKAPSWGVGVGVIGSVRLGEELKAVFVGIAARPSLCRRGKGTIEGGQGPAGSSEGAGATWSAAVMAASR